MKLSELRLKEVINLRDGRKLGFADDLDVDRENGKIGTLLVYPGTRMTGLFGKQEEVRVPWEKVRLVGDDIVLVDTE
ncbi:MAG TPA: YlmC/YmxH family sporulation protein [Clostridiales bacterium]|nr:YlmC/YmxH family sporulation protein [Clostridiales bacterium]